MSCRPARRRESSLEQSWLESIPTLRSVLARSTCITPLKYNITAVKKRDLSDETAVVVPGVEGGEAEEDDREGEQEGAGPARHITAGNQSWPDWPVISSISRLRDSAGGSCGPHRCAGTVARCRACVSRSQAAIVWWPSCGRPRHADCQVFRYSQLKLVLHHLILTDCGPRRPACWCLFATCCT